MSITRSNASDSPLRVAYILKMFPRLSETFILNELLELEDQGVEASVYSLMHPNDGRFHGRLSDLKLQINFVPREKPEFHWNVIRQHKDSESIPIEQWQQAADFLSRWGIAKDLDLLLRAVSIALDLRARGVQHVHAHFATIATRMAALVHLLTGIPFSFTSHAKDIFRHGVDRGLYRELVELSAFNITVSDFNRAYILDATPGIDAEKVIRLYNGIDLNFFSQASAEEQEVAEVPEILSVGRLVPKKGFPLLMRAVALLKAEGNKFRVVIVGDGESTEELLALCSQLDLEDCIKFTGALAQEEVLTLCKQTDVIALACVADSGGNRDALPTTLLEALACGKPVVSTALTGVPEIVTETEGAVVHLYEGEGANGVQDPSFDPCSHEGNIRAFADALSTTLDRLQAGEFSQSPGRSRAERLFDLKKNVSVLREYYEQSAYSGQSR